MMECEETEKCDIYSHCYGFYSPKASDFRGLPGWTEILPMPSFLECHQRALESWRGNSFFGICHTGRLLRPLSITLDSIEVVLSPSDWILVFAIEHPTLDI
jgi:hypothetical protein